MADETPETPEMRRFTAEARWVDMEALPVVLVNQAIGQVNSGEIVLTFGRVMPPPLLGTDEDKAQQIEAMGVLPIVPVVRLTMTISRLRAIKGTLEETIAIHERQAAAEEAEGEAPSAGEAEAS